MRNESNRFYFEIHRTCSAMADLAAHDMSLQSLSPSCATAFSSAAIFGPRLLASTMRTGSRGLAAGLSPSPRSESPPHPGACTLQSIAVSDAWPRLFVAFVPTIFLIEPSRISMSVSSSATDFRSAAKT
eukprot:SAG11_NODE_4521_length_1865_cov_2.355606_1_plen_128_part_10